MMRIARAIAAPAIQMAIATAWIRSMLFGAEPPPRAATDRGPPAVVIVTAVASGRITDRTSGTRWSGTCQGGSASATSGDAAAQTIAAARTQWRRAAERLRNSVTAISAAVSTSEI